MVVQLVHKVLQPLVSSNELFHAPNGLVDVFVYIPALERVSHRHVFRKEGFVGHRPVDFLGYKRKAFNR